jgi:hypothetical protein
MVPTNSLEIRNMDWIPIVLVTFKVLVLGTGMFFAIKWHYDQGKKGMQWDKRAFMRSSGKVAAIFVVSLLVVAIFTFVLVRVVGLNLSAS